MKPIISNDLHKRQDEVTKKHNTAITSRESYKAVNDSGQRGKEKFIVLEAISKCQPTTSRMLSMITGIERGNITRSLFDLVHSTPPQVKEAFLDLCLDTRRKVKHYTLIEWPQISLFNRS